MTLSGRTAVITGGGRGIGAAVARALAEAGAAVAVAARSREEVEAVARELVADGHSACAIPCDVTDSEAVEGLAREAAEALGPVDVLVNNAGVASSAPLKDTSQEEWHRLLAVNTTGTFLCTRAFLPGMLERGWGRVVNVASVAGLAGAAYISAYAASKHAVLGLTRSLAAEVARKGVTVNAVCPGYVDTGMTEQSVARIVEKTGLSAEEALESIYRMTPQHRVFDPEEVAYLVLFLADSRARGVNGHALVLDGGALGR